METHMSGVSGGYEMVFKNINVTIDKREILKNVSGVAKPGEMLAIMGPSGSGKTTLLNCLAGRRPTDSGTITLNGRSITKKMRRRISYVLQQDIFLTDLSCWDTIWFTALLRLDQSIPMAEKKQRVDEIIDALDMRKCLQTRIGDESRRGLSGGEKKRVTIACEILNNPLLLLLDEPTSGLDSATAHSLCCTVKKFAKLMGKTVVMSIHQPSSRLFSTFDKLYLLCEGQVAYFGDVQNCAPHFAELELPCPLNYNIADHILNIVRDSDEVKKQIIEGARKLRFTEDSEGQISSLARSVDSRLQSTVKQVANTSFKEKGKVNKVFVSDEDAQKISEHLTEEADEEENDWSAVQKTTKWPTSFLFQCSVLFVRNFKASWRFFFDKAKMIRTVLLCVALSLLYFQIDPVEKKIIDRNGVKYTLLMMPSYFSVTDILFSFFNDRLILNKERLAGYYRLSAYYLSKMLSDTLVALIIPTIFFTCIFWLSGISLQFIVYIKMLGVLYITMFMAHSIGSFYATAITDMHAATILAITTVTVSTISGGFYVRNFPPWAYFLTYISYITYSYDIMQLIDFSSIDIRCGAPGSTRYLACVNSTLSTNDTSANYIPREILINEYTLSVDRWSVWHSIAVLLGYTVTLRMISYIILRLRKPILLRSYE